jgi:acyl-coenzyme A thioesterase PaaI-like protein
VTEQLPVPWQFGALALDQTTRFASVVRRLVGLATSLEEESPVLEKLIRSLEVSDARMSSIAPVESAPRVGTSMNPTGRVYLDHARDIGAFNPCFPLYEIQVDGDTAVGSITFPLAYEGPPGLVHGGFIAVFFDCVIQHHNCDVGRAGKTTSLELSYRRPTPLDRSLSFAIRRVEVGNRINSTATLTDEGRVLCEAEMSAVASDRDNLPAVSPRRITDAL